MQTGLAVSSIVFVCWGFGAVRTLVMLAVLGALVLAFLLNGVPTENAGHRVGVVGFDRSALCLHVPPSRQHLLRCPSVRPGIIP